MDLDPKYLHSRAVDLDPKVSTWLGCRFGSKVSSRAGDLDPSSLVGLFFCSKTKWPGGSGFVSQCNTKNLISSAFTAISYSIKECSRRMKWSLVVLVLGLTGVQEYKQSI